MIQSLYHYKFKNSYTLLKLWYNHCHHQKSQKDELKDRERNNQQMHSNFSLKWNLAEYFIWFDMKNFQRLIIKCERCACNEVGNVVLPFYVRDDFTILG